MTFIRILFLVWQRLQFLEWAGISLILRPGAELFSVSNNRQKLIPGVWASVILPNHEE